MVGLPEAEAPRGLRLYAVGDVHGCAELLEDVHQRIDADLARRPADDWRVIHLGDYVDRGPDVRGAVGQAIARLAGGRCYCLRGNHEQYLIDMLIDPLSRTLGAWLAYGGVETLASYGVAVPRDPEDEAARHGLRDAMLAAIPAGHQQFLLGLPHLVRFGDYAFVHAGIRPGRALEAQRARDLVWIREPFLSDATDHGVVVVHGHTPVDRVEVRANRIGIDTGAVFGGTLSCLVLEGRERALLGLHGLHPLGPPEPAPGDPPRWW